MTWFKQNKYKVSPKSERTVDGIVFASKAEKTRYLELKDMEKNGEISDLQLQPVFILQEPFTKNGKKYQAIKYIADFQYIDKEGITIIEDCKGVRTKEYCIKQKLFEKKYSLLSITEYKKGGAKKSGKKTETSKPRRKRRNV